MSLASIILAPLALLPVAGALEAPRPVEVQITAFSVQLVEEAAAPPASGEPFLPLRAMAGSFRAPSVNQVRIEERLTIRIAPRPAQIQPDMLVDLPRRALAPRLTERKMGKCLAVSGIAGVQAEGDNRLILFMRDRRIVSAALERACHARDFYSGFYLSRSNDGQLCVDRDTLLSRSGANCKLTRMRQLIESGD